MRDDSVLSLNAITVRFGQSIALDRVDLNARRGSVLGLLGANGSGKTTTIRVACGLLRPSSGSGHCFGEPLPIAPARRRNIGYVAQHTTLYNDLSVSENLKLRAALVDSRLSTEFLERHQLTRLARVRVVELSGGWRQRTAFACALIGNPRLLILDEPTAGLDVVARDQLWHEIEALARAGKTVIISTHDCAEAARCSDLMLLANGRVDYSGPVAVIPGGSAGIEDLMRRSVATQGICAEHIR